MFLKKYKKNINLIHIETTNIAVNKNKVLNCSKQLKFSRRSKIYKNIEQKNISNIKKQTKTEITILIILFNKLFF